MNKQMKKLTGMIAVVLLPTLTGCQNLQSLNLPSLKVDTTQKTFTAPSFYGKELPSEFLTRHNPGYDSGHHFRGYHFGKRHWDF